MPTKQELYSTVKKLKRELYSYRRCESIGNSSEQYKLKVTLDMILRFIQWDKSVGDVECDDTISVTNYTLLDFQQRVCEGIINLEAYDTTNNDLDTNT